MRKILLVLSLILSFQSLSQLSCSELFISEYVEGWSNNKAIEIYNPTSSPVDLSNYFIARYSNGSSAASNANAVQLQGTVGAHDVYVGVIEKLDSAGQGQEAPVWDSLQAKADGYYCPDYNVSNAFYWNGNDAVLLGKGTLTSNPGDDVTTANGFAIVDIFGKIGENPANSSGVAGGSGAGWSTDFPYSTGLGVIISTDHSLIRKSTVDYGVTSNASFFNILDEWDSIPAVVVRLDANGDTLFGTSGNPILDGNWNSLGSHACDCNPASISDIDNDNISLYPNPSNGTFFIKHNNSIESVQILNALGQKINTIPSTTNLISINLGHKKGIYFVKIKVSSGNDIVRRVIVK